MSFSSCFEIAVLASIHQDVFNIALKGSFSRVDANVIRSNFILWKLIFHCAILLQLQCCVNHLILKKTSI